MTANKDKGQKTKYSLMEGACPFIGNIKEELAIGLFGSIDAGSKYFQALLDYHPQIYMIPGYNLMYYHAHYNEL